MKLLFCQDCRDIIAPNPEPENPRWCRCGRHAVWWIDPPAGVMRVHDKLSGFDRGEPRAFVIGISSMFLNFTGNLDAENIQIIIDQRSDEHLFKRQRSCIARIRPGEGLSTAWAELPVRR